MSFNQIKTSETLLKDKTGCPWIVGYFARKDGEGKTIPYSGKVNVEISPDFVINGPLSDFEYYNYINKYTHYADNYEISIRFNIIRKEIIDGMYAEIPISGGESTLIMPSENTTFNTNVDNMFSTMYFYYEDDIINEDVARQAFINNKGSIDNYFHTYYELETDRELINNLWNLNGKVISYIEDGKQVKKRMRVYIQHSQIFKDLAITSAAGGLYTTLQAVATQSNMRGQSTSASSFVTTFDRLGLTVELLNEDIDKSINYSIPINRCFTVDAPYDIFAIPYKDGLRIQNVKNSSGSYQDVTVYADNALSFANGIMANHGSSIYDVQILPYCPISGIIGNDGVLDLANVQNTDKLTVYTNLTTDSGNIISPIFFASRSSFTLDILLDEPIVITEPKIQNECDMYRLCSPNYASAFEFSAAKNGGIRSFNVDCTYLPYNPYIHINPDFGKLYGQDFNDSRGLICNGEFSIARIDSAWTQYQLNNKNYQASFNRQIENMEVQNKYQRLSEILGAGVGAVQGAAAGGYIGGGIGAALGGALSAGAGITDVAINDKLRNETLDYTKDQFGYQLGNIKATPNTLSRTTAFTYNNKYFPVLEYYTCTDEEKEALRNKIKYNGMTVMTIGKMRTYIQQTPTYIKGKLIRLENIDDDFNMLTAIADEINKGVFI